MVEKFRTNDELVIFISYYKLEVLEIFADSFHEIQSIKNGAKKNQFEAFQVYKF